MGNPGSFITRDHALVDFSEHPKISFGAVFCFELGPGGKPHGAGLFWMRPCPLNLFRQVRRIAWPKVQSGASIVYNLLHSPQPRAEYRNTTREGLGDGHWES